MIVGYHVKVTGRVQGVGFRYYTKLEADKLGLRGTVKNEPDGSVTIQVIGPDKVVRAFLEWCHKGPATALVDGLDYSESLILEADGFEILR